MPKKKRSPMPKGLSKEPSSMMKMHDKAPSVKKAPRPKAGGITAKDHGGAVPHERAKHKRQSTAGKPQPQIVKEQKTPVGKKKAMPKRKRMKKA